MDEGASDRRHPEVCHYFGFAFYFEAYCVSVMRQLILLMYSSRPIAREVIIFDKHKTVE